MHWYVFVENQSYGPYSDEQMCGFVAEGRITTNSLISNAPQSGFFSATEYDAFNLWSGAAQQSMLMPLVAAGAGAVQATTTNYAPIQPVQNEHPGMQSGGQPRVQPSGQYVPGQALETPTQLEPIQFEPAQVEPVQADVPTVHTPTIQPNNQSAQSCVFLVMAEISSSGEMAFLKALQGFGQAERIGDTVWLVRSTYAVEQIRNTLSQTLNQQDRLFILNSEAGKTAWFNIGTDLDHRIRELWDENKGYK